MNEKFIHGRLPSFPLDETVGQREFRLPPTPSALADYVGSLYENFGQGKSMMGDLEPGEPKFFLHRPFQGANDLLVIFNTKRCAYQCKFCTLPFNSSREVIGTDDVIEQFRRVVDRHAFSLSTFDKVTLSNDGSVLDKNTMPADALTEIVTAVGRMRRVRRVDLETRLEYVNTDRLEELNALARRAQIGILTGFETLDPRIRDKILGKRESLDQFRTGLDALPRDTPLTAYMLFKPDPTMTDEQAIQEAKASFQFLRDETSQRELPLTVRLNPMYRAKGSHWSRLADRTPNYEPPRLTDVMKVAEEAVALGTPTYIGLSTEDRADPTGTYLAREDYEPGLIKQVLRFNDRATNKFDWGSIITEERQ